MTEEQGQFVSHEECPDCSSSDALAVYSDGHTYCFSCQTHRYGAAGKVEKRQSKKVAGLMGWESLETRGLHARSITEETCRRFGYRVGTYNNKTVQVAPYYDKDGDLVAQKLRFKDKSFAILGNIKNALPFGSHCWQKAGKQIVLVEGEVDALSMSQAQDNKWPVVSIPNGAQGAAKHVAQHLSYFQKWEKVIIMFDSDDAGREAAKEVAAVIGMTAYIAELPLKDANEMLQAGRAQELVEAMWRSQQYRPDGIVELSTLREESLKRPEYGLSYPWPSLTEWSYGIRPHQLVALGAGVGAGKTDFYLSIAKHLMVEHNEPVGLFYLETPHVEVATRIAGKIAGKPLHLPDGNYTEEDRTAAWDIMQQCAPSYVYDSFGSAEWEPIREKIEFLYHSANVRYHFVDHLTALAQWEDDERKALDLIMSEMGGMVQRLPITIFFVSHLTTPEGRPHEEGGRVMARHLRGSRSIIQWATFILGLERNQQAEDEDERATSTLRCLKDRFAGKGNGKTSFLKFDYETFLLAEDSGYTPPVESDGREFQKGQV